MDKTGTCNHARLLTILATAALAFAMCLLLAACGGSGSSSSSSSNTSNTSPKTDSESSSASTSANTMNSAVALDLTKSLDGVKADANDEYWSEPQAIPNTDAKVSVCGKQRTAGFGYSVTMYFGSDSTNTVEAIGKNLYACYVVDVGLGSGSYTVVYSAGDSEASAQTYIATVNPTNELYFKYWSASGGVYMSSAEPLTGVASNVTPSSITIGSASYTLTPDTLTIAKK